MKKRLILFACLLYTIAFAAPLRETKIDPVALSRLTTALELPQGADLVAETQKRWLRKPDQERWEMTELSPEQRLFVLNWASEQELFSSSKPVLQAYDKVLIFGATTPCMQKRLDYLKELWEGGIRFQEIVWLTGERPLDKQVDELLDRCSNESEAAHILWNETPLPEEMRLLPITFVAVPMKGAIRPTTGDTILAWLNIAPEPCTLLFVSDQPFCGYQFAIAKAILPDAFQFDIVGRSVDPLSHPAAAAILLDSIARWIYQENLQR